MTDDGQSASNHTLAFHVVRYTSDLIRDEWVNIGVLLFDPITGDLRLRLVENQGEFSRIRRLHPTADEDSIRDLAIIWKIASQRS